MREEIRLIENVSSVSGGLIVSMMKASTIAILLLSLASSPVLAEADAEEESSERIEEFKKATEEFHAAELKMRAAVPGKDGEVVINVRADGTIRVGDKELSLDELKAELPKLSGENKDRSVRIRGDAALEYQKVVEVIDVCQKAGLWDIAFATQRAAIGDFREGECEDKLEATAEVVPDLDNKFFGSVETRRQPWIIEGEDGSLQNTMGDNIEANDLLLIEQTSNCVSSHQGEHKMEFCDAVKTEEGVELEISGGAPAYMSSLTVLIDAKRQFACRFNAVYPSDSASPRWKVTKKAMKLKSAIGEPGSRLRGWISVEFDEIDGTTGAARSYKIEGYFKPVIQSSPAAEPEEDK